MDRLMRCAFSLIFFSALVGGAPMPSRQSAASLSGGVEAMHGGGSAADVRYIELMTAPELAAHQPDTTMLASIYSETEMRFKLEQSRHVTVLMPTNRAIERAARQGIDLERTPYEVSLPILQNFIVPEVIKVSQLEPGRHVFQSIEGSELVFEKPTNPNRPVTVNGENLGGQVDNANGVAYMLDALIYPSTMNVEAIREQKRIYGDEEFGVPEHVELTNEMHSRYDRDPTNHRVEPDDSTNGIDAQGVLQETADTEEPIEAAVPGAGVLPPPDHVPSPRKSHLLITEEPESVYSRASVRRRARRP